MIAVSAVYLLWDSRIMVLQNEPFNVTEPETFLFY